VTRPTRNTEAGRRYLDLQREAKRTHRPTDELIQLYALECFLDRLGHSAYADRFVLKGGVLLAALDARRPTRDIDFAALALESSAAKVLDVVREIATVTLSDGLVFDTGSPTVETIRDEDQYSGLRITLSGTLSRAAIRLHVDINVGDPIWPAPQLVEVPRLLGGTLMVKGYPLEMVLAEKLITAIARGTTNTRWRDFLDVYTLIRRHSVEAQTLRSSMQRVAQYRDVTLSSPVDSVEEDATEDEGALSRAVQRTPRIRELEPHDRQEPAMCRQAARSQRADDARGLCGLDRRREGGGHRSYQTGDAVVAPDARSY